MTTRDQVEPSEAELEEYLAATSSTEVEVPDEVEEYDLGQDEGDEQASASDSAESEEVKSKKSGYVEFDTPEQKARVAEITRKRHEAERKAAKLEGELEQYRKVVEPPKEAPLPSADPVTDPDVYAQQMRAREQYIRDQSKYETEAEQRKQQSAALQQQQEERLRQTYNKNVTRLNIDPVKLAKASETCLSFGLSNELAAELLDDDDGPAIVAYLGNNIDDLSEVTSLSTAKAIKYIEQKIRSKLHVKQVSKTPMPATKVGGMRKSDSSTTSGYKFR